MIADSFLLSSSEAVWNLSGVPKLNIRLKAEDKWALNTFIFEKGHKQLSLESSHSSHSNPGL